MSNRHCGIPRPWRPAPTGLLALLFSLASTVQATPPLGFSSQSFRGRITANVNANQWNPNPLFTLLIQTSTSPEWGFDVVQGTTEFAPMDVMGRPSQSGWHDHPTALTIGVVVQGTVWAQEKPNLTCLSPRSAGTVFFERRGEIHNVYNLDPRVPAVVRVIHFIERNEVSTRRDQPDQVTGDPSVASPPPPVCTPAASVAASSDGSVVAEKKEQFRP